MTKRSYLVVVFGCIVILVSMGMRQSFGLFLKPISDAMFAGEIAVFSIAFALQNLFWGASQPFVGAIADKWGTGRTIAVASVVYAAGLWMIAHAGSAWDLYTGLGVFIGIAGSGTTFAVILAVMARNIPRERRSVVFGIATAIATTGQMVMVPLSQVLIGRYGWSLALIVLAALVLTFVPLSMVLTGSSKDVTDASEGAGSLGEAVGEARRHSGYLFLTAGFFVCGFQVFTVGFHLPKYLASLGFAPDLAVTSLVVLAATNFVGSLGWGWLGGRYSKKRLLSTLYLLRSGVFCAFLLVPITEVSMPIIAALMGFLWLGTVPLTNGLVGQIFGIKYLATLTGIVFASHQLGATLGISLAGWLFDTTGSYDIVWEISIALGVVAAILHWPIKEKPVERAAPAPVPAE